MRAQYAKKKRPEAELPGAFSPLRRLYTAYKAFLSDPSIRPSDAGFQAPVSCGAF